MARSYLPIPTDWTEITLAPDQALGFISRVDSGGTPPTTEEGYWDGDIPWLTPREITRLGDAIYVADTERKITASGLRSSAAKLMPPDSVLLTKRAPVGAVAINAVAMATNQGFMNFQCGPSLRPLYLAHWLRANRIYLLQVANGSTYPELYPSDLREFVAGIPPLQEQDAILGWIRSIQFLGEIGIPLEQAAASTQEMVAFQDQTRRIGRVKDTLVEALLAGEIRVMSSPSPDREKVAGGFAM
jgi:type I restriction enzyme S subunit